MRTIKEIKIISDIAYNMAGTFFMVSLAYLLLTQLPQVVAWIITL